ncbi:hypothetical protein AOLI_G00072330 [Acnodon oligacanthus]
MVVTSRTEVRGEGFSGKSCSKICLVNVYPADDRSKSKRMNAMVDEQSNLSLARSEFFDMFKVNSFAVPYTLQTCAGVGLTAGRRAFGYVIESIDGATAIPLPMLIECNMIPKKRDEIPTPSTAQGHPHPERVACKIPPQEDSAEILLLLGRDILRVHNVRSQINGPHDAPYAERLDLSWVIVGDVCLGSTHKPSEVTSLKTHILTSGRPTHFPPCENHFTVKTEISLPDRPLTLSASESQQHLSNGISSQRIKTLLTMAHALSCRIRHGLQGQISCSALQTLSQGNVGLPSILVCHRGAPDLSLFTQLTETNQASSTHRVPFLSPSRLKSK